MGPEMHLELLAACEGFAAVIARIRLLAGVCPEVYHKLT
jgi:hypothetical protein